MAAAERHVTEIIIDASDVSRAERLIVGAFDHMGADAAAAQAKMQASIEKSMKIYGRDLPQAMDRVSDAYGKLQGKLDPVVKAQQRLEREMTQSLGVINRAVLTGVTTEQEAAKTIARLKEQQIADIARVRQAQERLNDTPLAGTRHVGVNDNMVSSRRQNLGFQLQDVGVSAIGGMPLGMIAAQQGSQIFGAYAGPGGGMAAFKSDIRAMGTGIAEAGTSLAATLGMTGAMAAGFGAVAVAAGGYYLATRESSADLAEKLKAENELIGRVAGRWGAAMPALKAYNDEIQRAADLEQRKEAADAAVGQLYRGPKQQFPNLQADYADAFKTAGDAGLPREKINALTTAYIDLKSALAIDRATVDQAKALASALIDLSNSAGGSDLFKGYAADATAFGNTLDEVGPKAETILQEVVVDSGLEVAKTAAQWRVLTDAVGAYGDAIGRMQGIGKLPLTPAEQLDEAFKQATDASPLGRFDPYANFQWFQGKQRLDNQDAASGPTAALIAAGARPNREDMLGDAAANDPVRQAVKAGEERLRQAREQNQLAAIELRFAGDMSGAREQALAAARTELEIARLKIDANGTLAGQLRAQAQQEVQIAQAMRQAQFASDLRSDVRSMNLSPQDQRIERSLRGTGYGLDSREANAMRQMDRVQEQRDSLSGFAHDFSDGILKQGKSVGEALGEAIRNSATRSLENMLDRGIEALTRWAFPTADGPLAQGTMGSPGAVSLGIVEIAE